MGQQLRSIEDRSPQFSVPAGHRCQLIAYGDVYGLPIPEQSLEQGTVKPTGGCMRDEQTDFTDS